MLGSYDAASLAAAAEFINEARRNIRKPDLVEAQVRSLFTLYLGRIYPDPPYWVRRHVSATETALKLGTIGPVKTVFVDNLVDQTAIEYETNLKSAAKFNVGFEQVRGYCAGAIQKFHVRPEQVLGVLSDTLEWHAYEVLVVPGATSQALRAEDITLSEIASIDLHIPGISADSDARLLLDFLGKHLGRLCSRPLSPDNIATDLGFDSPYAKDRTDSMRELVRRAFAERPGYASLIKTLWANYVDPVRTRRASVFDTDTYTAEFYLVTLAKLLCSNVLAGKALESDEPELRTIVTGRYFNAHRLENVVEYDYFGWLNDDPYVRDICAVAAKIQQDLLAYDFENLPEDKDVFGQLLAQLAQRTNRLLLGQEWTPSWLAEKMAAELVRSLSPTESPHFLDMCCGSGAMIAQVLRRADQRLTSTERADPDNAVAHLAQSITGFDIDPLAVLLSRITWIIAMRGFLDGRLSRSVTIPIYHADSLFPSGQTGATRGTRAIKLDLDGQDVAVPSWLLRPENQPLFDEVLQQAYATAMNASRNARSRKRDYADPVQIARAVDIWRSNQKVPANDALALADAVLKLATRIAELDLKGRNGIWAFLLRNSYRPILVAGNFNGLISNPPWLAMSKIGENPYKQSLRALAEHYSIQPTGSAFLHMDLAPVFLTHALHRYMAHGARFACILPHTVLNADNHVPFRQSMAPKARGPAGLSAIWVVEKGTFKNRAIVLLGEKGRTSPMTLPGAEVGRNGEQTLSWNWNAGGGNGRWVHTALQRSIVAGDSALSLFTQGADVMPRRLVFVREMERRGARIRIEPITRNDPIWGFAVADAKAPWDRPAFKGNLWVPALYLYRTILSKHLAPFDLALAQAVPTLAPMERDSTGVWTRIASSDIAAIDRPTADLFVAISETIRKTKQNELKRRGIAHREPDRTDLWEGYLDHRGKLTGQIFPDGGFLVVTGAGGDSAASAYVSLRPRAAVDRLLIDQTLYWAVVPTETEALYLVGMFNSDALHEMLAGAIPEGEFGGRHQHTRPFRVTPMYDPSDPVHRAVVKATRAVLAEFIANRPTLETGRNVLNPQTRLPWRRREVRLFVRGFSSFGAYDHACRKALGLR